MQRQCGVIINQTRYHTIPEVLAALRQLPLPEFDATTTPDPDATVMILQREQGLINSAKNPTTRFIGTKRLSDCIFVIFTIQEKDGNKNYFTIHIDGNKTYDLEKYLKAFNDCAISATILGACANHPIATRNLHGLIDNLLNVTKKLNLDITIASQCIQDSMTPTKADWPRDFTFRLRNKANVLHRRLFGTDLPKELAQCQFDASMQLAAAEIKGESVITGIGLTWSNFVNFIIDGDAIHAQLVHPLLLNARTLARTKEQFADLYKRLFSATGFHATESVLREIRALPSIKANNFVFDTTTQKIIIIPAAYPDGKYALQRKLRIADLRSLNYAEAYNPSEGYRFPSINPQTLAIFKCSISQLLNLPQGLSPECIDGFMRTLMMGHGTREIGINVTLEICWLAYHWLQTPEQELAAPLTALDIKMQNHLRYLNKITGVQFVISGEKDAVFVSSDNTALQRKLAAIGIASEISGQQLLVKNLMKYTKQLSNALLPKKQTQGLVLKL